MFSENNYTLSQGERMYFQKKKNLSTQVFLSLLSVCYSERKEITAPLTILHSERPKLHTILAILSAIGLKLQRGGII